MPITLDREQVLDVLNKVLGPNWNYADEYGEPGYEVDHPDGPTPLVVFANYWCPCHEERFLEDDPHNPGQQRPKLHTVWEHNRLHVEQLLVEQGVDFCWYDEWFIDHRHSPSKAYRTSGDSYSWQPSVIFTEHGEPLTPDDDIETWIEWCAAEPTERIIPTIVHDTHELIDAGFEPHNGEYANGWYPGQTDNPVQIIETARGQYPDDTEFCFALTANGQFDTHFELYVRTPERKPE